MTFYPKGYERVEAPSDYMKFKKEGEYRIRILREPIIGFETWDTENKPHRVKTFEEGANQPSKDGKVKEFHAMIVWDYEHSMVRLLNITQRTILDWLFNQTQDEDWKDPTAYDIVIKREGMKKDDTKYFPTAKLPKEMDKEISDAFGAVTIEDEEYFNNGHPIKREEEGKKKDKVGEVEDVSGDIPF